MTGRVEQGTVKVGEEVEILGLTQVFIEIKCTIVFMCVFLYVICLMFLSINLCVQGGPLKTTVTGVEMFKKILDRGEVSKTIYPSSFLPLNWIHG